MNIKDFPKENNPSPEDFLLIQKDSGITKHIKISDLPSSGQEGLAEELIGELARKSPIGHTHVVTDVDGLLGFVAGFNSHLQPDSINQHEIWAVKGLQEELNRLDASSFLHTSQIPPPNPTNGTRWTEVNSSGIPIVDWFFYNSKWVSFPLKMSAHPGSDQAWNQSYIFPLDARYKYVFIDCYFTFIYLNPLTETKTIRPTIFYMDSLDSPFNALADITIKNRQARTSETITLTINQEFNPNSNNHLFLSIIVNNPPVVHRFAAQINYSLIRR